MWMQRYSKWKWWMQQKEQGMQIFLYEPHWKLRICKCRDQSWQGKSWNVIFQIWQVTLNIVTQPSDNAAWPQSAHKFILRVTVLPASLRWPCWSVTCFIFLKPFIPTFELFSISSDENGCPVEASAKTINQDYTIIITGNFKILVTRLSIDSRIAASLWLA